MLTSGVKISLSIIEALLYLIQLVTLIFAFILLCRLRNLGKARPVCGSGMCQGQDIEIDMDADSANLCKECKLFREVLAKRLPTIYWGFVLYLGLFCCNFAIYTS